MTLEEYIKSKGPERMRESFALSEEEKRKVKAVEREKKAETKMIEDVNLEPITGEEAETYLNQILSPLILCLIGAICLVVGISYYTNMYVGSIATLVYLIICTIMGFLPIWVLILMVLGSAGIIAYSLSSSIGGGGGE